MPRRVLSKAFLDWADTKLSLLRDARREHALGHPGADWGLLLGAVMAEYDLLPFALPHFPGNLDALGCVQYTPAQLRMYATAWFHNSSVVPSDLTLRRHRGIVEGHLPPNAEGHHLWALTEGQRLRELACAALAIPMDTPNALVPAQFLQKYLEIARHEFNSLNSAERVEWHALARSRILATQRGETDMIIVQDRQAAFLSRLRRLVQTELDIGGLGPKVLVHIEGFYIGEEDRIARRFEGQMSTYENAERWRALDDYQTSIVPHWVAFVQNEVQDHLLGKLPELKRDVPGSGLQRFRDRLESFFLELFKKQCNLDGLDPYAFWTQVAANPTTFVSRERLPNGIVFRNPQLMPEQEFRAVYEHVWCCQTWRKGMIPDDRFVYNSSIINKYITLESASKLRLVQSRRIELTLSNNPAPSEGLERTWSAASQHVAPVCVIHVEGHPYDPIAVASARLHAPVSATHNSMTPHPFEPLAVGLALPHACSSLDAVHTSAVRADGNLGSVEEVCNESTS